MINEESSSTIVALKNELARTKRDLAKQTNFLNVAHDQLKKLKKGIKIDPTESMEPSTICKKCGRDGEASESSDEEVDDDADDGVTLEDITVDEETAVLFENNPDALKAYKERMMEIKKMKGRLSKVEKLLSDNLENMNSQEMSHI